MKGSYEMNMKQELLAVLTAHLIISSCGSGFSTDKKIPLIRHTDLKGAGLLDVPDYQTNLF
jgi:hypothetical protein